MSEKYENGTIKHISLKGKQNKDNKTIIGQRMNINSRLTNRECWKVFENIKEKEFGKLLLNDSCWLEQASIVDE